jgi:sulfur-oxidizing protein SoxX
MKRVLVIAAAVVTIAAGIYLALPRAQGAASADAAIKSSWATATPEWQARLVQDETQKVCSQYRNAPPKAVADAIMAREKATIVYPADGKLMGDWKKGEVLAQSGYGGRFTDYPPRAENGGNCYACHQLDAKELSFGTLGPSLSAYGVVLAVVAAAYEQSPAFGLYVQVHAEVGARSSQLAKLKISDLQPGRLLVPTSKKGGGQRKADRTPVPLTPGLEAKLRAVAAGRGPDEPLLRRPSGEPWAPGIADHSRPFERAARAAGLPAGTTVYSLRHSSIVRALLRGVPIKVVADWHNTSTIMIEKHYRAFLKDHYDELVRAALIDTSPAENANVVALRARP